MAKTKEVLEWLRAAMEAVDGDPSQENITSFLIQVIKNKEVVEDAITDAIRPELRDVAASVSKLLAAGV